MAAWFQLVHQLAKIETRLDNIEKFNEKLLNLLNEKLLNEKQMNVKKAQTTTFQNNSGAKNTLQLNNSAKVEEIILLDEQTITTALNEFYGNKNNTKVICSFIQN